MTGQTENKNIFKKMFTVPLTHDQKGQLGPILFVLIMVLVAFTALNEPVRMAVFTAQYEGRAIERGAVIFDDACVSCHGRDGKGLEGIAPSLNSPDMFDGARLEEMGWTGSLEDYLELTIAAGRPVLTADYPQTMPTWSQEYGGPLRPDQVRDVVAYVMNYQGFYGDDYVAPEDDVTDEPEEPAYEAVGIDMESELPEGDAARGEALFLNTDVAPDGGTLNCNACHSTDGTAIVGPSMQGLGGRIPPGVDPADYVRESIVLPNATKSEGFENVNMTEGFGDRLDAQSLADIIAYLLAEFGE